MGALNRQIEALDKENLAVHKANADMLALPGLLADRKAGRVTVYAMATKLNKGELFEFYLIPQNGGKDYESIAITPAKPSDVHKALEFIGMKRGQPQDTDQARFWPKGERVVMTFSAESAGLKPTRAEQFGIDRQTGKTLPELGFVFVGSVTAPDGTYLADVKDPNSIVSAYNEPTTVLDVPRSLSQGAFYGRQVANPDRDLLPSNAVIQVVLEPEYKDGRKRVAELTLTIQPATGGATTDVKELEFTVTDTAGAVLNKDTSLQAAMELLASIPAKGQDPFVTLDFGRRLPLGTMKDLATMLAAIDTDSRIRIEPPKEGQLFYRAFAPNEEWRDRTTRLAQPWELHLGLHDGTLTGQLVQIEQVWQDDKDRPDFKVTEHPVASADALRTALDRVRRQEMARMAGLVKDENTRAKLAEAIGQLPETAVWKDAGDALVDELQNAVEGVVDFQMLRMKVILVYADPAVQAGDLMAFIKPALTTHPTVHVFQK